MIFETKTRTQPISKEQVWRAWKRIKQGGKTAGVDGVSMAEIAAHPKRYLYPLWNRLSSGSYFPPSVREVAIPKGNGKERLLGIPTIVDRVAQEVIRAELEKILEPRFLPNSFGYRPNKSAHDALRQCAANSWARHYVVDVDIKGFFDHINHTQLMEMLRKHTNKRHILLYCERWLSASVLKRDGVTVQQRTEGTPQGGVISPLLANLYLHEVFDTWMSKNQPNTAFERYADDIVIHTCSKKQSQYIYDKLKARMNKYSLSLNEEKSKIVYCYRQARGYKEEKDVPVSFDFLGFTFKPRLCERKDKERFWGFTPAISQKNEKRIGEVISKMHIKQQTGITLQQLARKLTPKIRGWLQYYGIFRPSSLSCLFARLNYRLIQWAMAKYRENSYRKMKRWIKGGIRSYPYMFPHWEHGFTQL